MALSEDQIYRRLLREHGDEVCASWRRSFAAFQRDMGPRPPNLIVARLDLRQPFCKENCFWTDVSEVRRLFVRTSKGIFSLRRLLEDAGLPGRNHFDWARTLMNTRKMSAEEVIAHMQVPHRQHTPRAILYRGKQVPLRDLARRFKINRETLAKRLRNGKSIEEAVATPVEKKYATRKKETVGRRHPRFF